MTTRWLCLLALGAVTLLGASACDVSSPERFVRQPIIKSFSPESRTLTVFAGDTVRFSISAIDPGEQPLRFDFALGDSVVANVSRWAYAVDDTGTVRVAGRVFNRDSKAEVVWRLRRVLPENQAPVIVDFDPAEPNPTAVVGELVDFSIAAIDPEGKGLTYIFTVNDSLVSGSNRYTYPTSKIGDFSVKAIASDGERFTTHAWLLSVHAEPDSIPPAPVMLVSVETGPETGQLVARWIAVGDDSLEGLPSQYILRTSRVPIDNELAWIQASDRPGEPPPASAGEVQQMIVRFLKPQELVYVAVRAVDDFGNYSPLGPTLGANVKGNDVRGVVRDAMTGGPVPGVVVGLLSDSDTTGADGSYALTRLPDGSGVFTVRDENDGQSYGAYFDIASDVNTIADESTVDFWMIPNLPLQTTRYASFLEFIKAMSDRGGPFAHLLKTWNEPVDVFVLPFVGNGLDYERVIKGALLEWETLVGIDLFRFVDSKPALGFFIDYSGSIERDFYRTLVEDSRQLPLLGQITMRTIYGPSSEQMLDTIAGHEIGHALGVEHSLDPNHLMVGSQAAVVTAPTLDEIQLIRVMYRLPRGQSMAWYLYD